MPDVSIVIPIAPYHKDVAQRAIDSAKAQLAPCVIIPVEDSRGRGAGWARNQGLAKVNTHFTVFLDADDWLEPNFVASCLQHIKPNTYVYTDWFQDGQAKEAPAKAWGLDGSWHVITTLLETSVVKRAGGFDESLPTAEDTAFYWHITRHGVCGLHLAAPLFHYGTEGRRGKSFMQQDFNGNLIIENGTPLMKPQLVKIMQALVERYKNMTCCGDTPLKPSDSGQPGDVEAQALWLGNRRELGVISGRLYPRSSYPHTLMVAPVDIDARPDMWQRVNATPELKPAAPLLSQGIAVTGKVYDLDELAQVMFAPNGATPAPLTAEQLVQTLSAEVRPDVSKILHLARNSKVASETQPVKLFVLGNDVPDTLLGYTLDHKPIVETVEHGEEKPKAKRRRKPKA